MQRVLAGEHRMVVDRFIEDAAGVLSEGLGIVERNELEVNLRFYVETQLVPGLLTVNALLLEASSEALERDLPEWIERAARGGGVPHRGRTGRRSPLVLPAGGEPGAVPRPVLGRGGVPGPPPEHGALGGEGQDFRAPGPGGALGLRFT